jgi:hypothetical protein
MTTKNDFLKGLRKATICIDFDGVIHSYTSGWVDIATIPDPPVKGAFDAIYEYMKHFVVCIYSSRSVEPAGILAMEKWFANHGFKEVDKLYFPDKKPPAFITLDDRGITFTGTFPTVDEIKNFKPWYKTGTKTASE